MHSFGFIESYNNAETHTQLYVLLIPGTATHSYTVTSGCQVIGKGVGEDHEKRCVFPMAQPPTFHCEGPWDMGR